MVAGGAIRVTALAAGEAHSIPVRIADTLFRIGQEALANAVRHANPSSLLISLTFGEAALQLSVEDDGKGFVEDAHSAGFGIRGMRKRADTISADLKIRSTLRRGTAVHVLAPMPARLTRKLWPAYIWSFFWEHRFHGHATSKNPDPIVDRR
jgi:signal transduction histidine kinase